MANQNNNQAAQTSGVSVDTKDVLQYQDKKIVLKQVPLKGQNVAVYVRPGDNVAYEMENIDIESLEYRLVGGDIVVTMPNGGVFTFVSMALMGYSENPPSFLGAGGQKYSLGDVLSQVKEVNDLPFDSIAVEADIQQEDRVKKIVEEYEKAVEKLTQTITQQENVNNSLLSTESQTQKFAFEETSTKIDNFMFQESRPTVVESVSSNEGIDQYLGRYTQLPKYKDDFDAYKPEVEMIPKPEVEMIPKPEVEMIPKPEVEMIPKPEVEMIPKPEVEMIPKPEVEMIPKPDYEFIPKNDFTNYGTGNGTGSRTGDGTGSGTGDGTGNGTGDGTGGEVSEAAKPAFYFKATAHQVKYSETVNESGQVEVLGGGGSINGYKFNSITNQFESEVLDMSDRDEDMVIHAENSGYFSNLPTSKTQALTFSDLASGESVTVDGLTLTATDAVSAADVAAGFASLVAGATAGNAVTNGKWSGALSTDWTSDVAVDAAVAFTSQASNANISVSSVGSSVPTATEPDTVETYLSRVLRFEPQMPEGFYVDNFTLSGLPTGVTIFDKEGNIISGSSITKDQMLFKDALGNTIEYGSADFLTNFKSVEFVMKYTQDLPETFNVAVTSNYKLDDAYAGTTDIGSSQSYTNDYTFALKDIASADDYTYNKTDFTNAKEEGFILPKETNSNIIKDGSGNSTIYGGIVKDTVYDGAGNDTVYLSAGEDKLYGGSGTNYIYGDTKDALGTKYTGVDSVSYERVQSFASSEVKLLEEQGLISTEENQKLTGTYTQTDTNGNPIANSLDVDMLASYKGVYVALDGVHVDTLNIDVDGDGDIDSDDKINTISKFADREGKFTYDENGNALTTTITQGGLENLQALGYDILQDIENVTGSSYNDTIYGNLLEDNVLSGLSGSDTLNGRGGNNTLLGGDGYDTLLSGSGEDHIDGGGDTDTVSYENATAGITVRFDRPNEEEFDYAGRDDGSGNFVIKDTILNVEDIRGSAYADTIYGNGSTNYIEGGGGDDVILAGGGYDFIDGGAGSDKITYNPADYPDIATNPNFMDKIRGITVDLNSSDFVMVKETSTNRLIDLVKSVEQVTATNGNDVIYGNNSSAETFWGLDGDDRLESRGGNDTLYGGDDNDYIRPGAGLDTSYGGEGTDYLELYDDGVAAVNGTRTLKLTEDGTIQHSTDGGTTWVYGYSANGGINLAYEFEGFSGSTSADTLYGNSQNNVLNGHHGDDTIHAQGGNDTIRGGVGADTLYGGDGDDTIYGDQNDDIIDAGAGDDIVYGYGKYDTSSNKDTIDGGTGTNTLNYSGTNNGFVLNMASVDGDGYATVEMSTGAIYDDKVKNFTKIIGSTGADTITANDSGMYLDGGNGTDKLYGGTRDDTIIARNTSGEILDGGGGDDTLQLVQNVDFRNIMVTNFEVLDMQTYNAYFNLSQLSQFKTIQGSGNFYLYGTNGNETLNFSVLDLKDMSGKVYIYGYNGDDEFNFNGAILGDDATFYLDAGSGIDTLKLGDNQTLEMTDNYYNTFEDFDVGEDSTLNVYALNDTARAFYANNKNFDGVDSANDGVVNFIGGGGNDTFYVDYTALDSEKLSVEGGGGNDIVDIQTALLNSSLTLDDTQIFADIERLELYSISNTNSINIDADALATWTGGEDLTLDIANNTQGTQVTITDTQVTVNDVPVEADITNITVNSSYSVTPVDDPSLSFNMAVV